MTKVLCITVRIVEYQEHIENIKINRCKNEPPEKWI